MIKESYYYYYYYYYYSTVTSQTQISVIQSQNQQQPFAKKTDFTEYAYMTSLPLWVKRRCAKSENLLTQKKVMLCTQYTLTMWY